jgi:hypothetical protein
LPILVIRGMIAAWDPAVEIRVQRSENKFNNLRGPAPNQKALRQVTVLNSMAHLPL